MYTVPIVVYYSIKKFDKKFKLFVNSILLSDFGNLENTDMHSNYAFIF